ncbi:hypothetical protein HYQ44_011328 [Verticillium longisporum]|nr:hypothetical protein HYQ44_011328 [Verticillium longisporum]
MTCPPGGFPPGVLIQGRRKPEAGLELPTRGSGDPAVKVIRHQTFYTRHRRITRDGQLKRKEDRENKAVSKPSGAQGETDSVSAGKQVRRNFESDRLEEETKHLRGNWRNRNEERREPAGSSALPMINSNRSSSL